MSATQTIAQRNQQVGVHVVPCRGPGDLQGVQALVDSGAIVPSEIVAVMGKTEGNGCVNDHTREYASSAWCHFLALHLGCAPDQVEQRVALVMSGGCEGVISPHFTVFTRRWLDAPRAAHGPRRLVIGTAHTPAFQPEELGREAQIQATAQAVRRAMDEAGIVRDADVHFVQIKCPLITSEGVQQALARGREPVTRDTYESMAYSRGASALGVAQALGECPAERAHDGAVLHDGSCHSSRASVSAGIELSHNVVIVLGEAVGAASPYRITHTTMRDAVDAASVRDMLREAYVLNPDADDAVQPGRLVTLLAKAEASPDGQVRGLRHTMLNDSDIHATRHARAVVGGVLASLVGQTALYVSGGAEHQGPPGGGPVAAILHVESTP